MESGFVLKEKHNDTTKTENIVHKATIMKIHAKSNIDRCQFGTPAPGGAMRMVQDMYNVGPIEARQAVFYYANPARRQFRYIEKSDSYMDDIEDLICDRTLRFKAAKVFRKRRCAEIGRALGGWRVAGIDIPRVLRTTSLDPDEQYVLPDNGSIDGNNYMADMVPYVAPKMAPEDGKLFLFIARVHLRSFYWQYLLARDMNANKDKNPYYFIK